ncbi:MAG: hypothetical protein H0W30_10685 [Gemmatimonadaceae bacterium]|nr:hypothetical protein [Gemmatimonadaceae bacterium]MDQ3517079.1 hypothetical protein [Gemmatimonadota bacterium]
MRQSIVLRAAPSLRQAKRILISLQQMLTERGATVELVGNDALRFRMPYPWNTHRLGWLIPVTSGRAEVSAGGGGPWRVRYQLNFSMLRYICIALSIVLAIVGREWPRLTLLNGLIILWLAFYALLASVASSRFSKLLEAASSDIVERRQRARPEAGSATDSEPDSGSDVPKTDTDTRTEPSAG